MPDQPKRVAFTRLNPTTDVVFKILFSQNEEILIALLSAVLDPASPITEAKVQNPELPKGKVDEKGTIMDIRVSFADGTLVGVEMQSGYQSTTDARWLYYWAKNYAAQLKRGNEYGKLRKVIGIFFLNYSMKEGQFHGVYQVLERNTGRCFSQMLELHTIELPRLNALKLQGADKAPNKLEFWSRFFTSRDPEEIAALTKADPMIEKAEKRLAELSADPYVRTAAEEREFGMDLWMIEKMGARDDGLEEGRVEGRVEGLRQSILLVCERFGIDLTPERRAIIEDPRTNLEELMKQLLDERRWPD